jgi:DNA-binding MarR family transcriptional regulator
MSTDSFPSGGTTGPSGFQLEHFLPYRLSLLTNTVSQGMARRYRDKHDISVTEWRILAVLGRFQGLTASEIVDRTAMDKVAISRAVKSLVGKQLLKRETDETDRRRMRLFITPVHGEKVLREVVPLALLYEKRLLEALTGEETSAFSRTLKKLHQRAREISGA